MCAFVQVCVSVHAAAPATPLGRFRSWCGCPWENPGNSARPEACQSTPATSPPGQWAHKGPLGWSAQWLESVSRGPSQGGGLAGRQGGGQGEGGVPGTALGAGLAGARLWEAGAAVEAPAAWGLALGGSACCCGQRAARVRCWGESSPRATSCWQLRAVRCAQSAAADVKAVVVRATAGSPRGRWGSPSRVCGVRAARLA